MSKESPYQTPGVELMRQDDTASVLLETPRAYGPSEGIEWIKEGFSVFKANPGIWIGVLVVYLVIMFMIGLVPFLGSLATIILGPVFSGGFTVLARNAENGSAAFDDLFAGFKEKFGQLAVLALINFGFLLIPMLVMFILGFSGAVMGQNISEFDNPEGLGIAMVVMFLVCFIAVIPAIMGMWFAPSLIMFNDLSSWDAFKLSVSGCLKNILPFIIYIIASLVLAFIAAIPFGLGFLILVPTIIGSIYKAYKRVFLQ